MRLSQDALVGSLHFTEGLIVDPIVREVLNILPAVELLRVNSARASDGVIATIFSSLLGLLSLLLDLLLELRGLVENVLLLLGLGTLALGGLAGARLPALGEEAPLIIEVLLLVVENAIKDLLSERHGGQALLVVHINRRLRVQHSRSS